MSLTHNNIKHVAVYLRISDEKKEAGKRVESEETLRNHKQILISYAKRNKYSYETFEEVLSGGIADIENRPKLHEILNRIEEFDAILVVELSRLSRNGKISELLLEYCQDYRKLILTPESMYDLNNEMDALMFRLGSAISEHERKIIGKRIKNNKLQMTKHGQNASGSVPLGYIRNPKTKKLEIDGDKAEIIRYAFSLCSQGYGASRISQALNDLDYKTKKGNQFTTRAVKDMLKTQTYKGFLVYHNYNQTKRKGKMVREAIETVVIEDAHPAIIDPELFDSIQDERNKRSERYSGGRERQTIKGISNILKDLLYCGVCGRKIRIVYDPNRNKSIIRRCVDDVAKSDNKCNSSGFLAMNVEHGVIVSIFEEKDKLEQEISSLSLGDIEQLNKEQELLKNSIERQISSLNDEMKGLLRLELKYEMKGEANPIQEEFIKEEKQNNINKKQRLERQLEELKIKMDKPSIHEEIDKRKKSIEYIDSIIKYDLSKKEDVEQINRTLKKFIRKIYYSRVLPEYIKELGFKNPKRSNYPADIKIEYFE